MEKISILEFCEEYNKRATDELKNQYINENLEVKTYLPFLTKTSIASQLVEVCSFKSEDYTDENGRVKRRATDRIHLNSIAKYVLFIRAVIENYTNLTVTTEGFYEEYDALNQSGLLDELIVNYENHTSIIPEKELSELKMLIQFKQDDALTNYATPQSFLYGVIDRLKAVAKVVATPFANIINDKLNEIPKEKLDEIKDKIVEISKNSNFTEM